MRRAYRSGLELYDRLVLVLEDLDALDFHDLLEFLLQSAIVRVRREVLNHERAAAGLVLATQAGVCLCLIPINANEPVFANTDS